MSETPTASTASCALPHLGLISVHGADAASFLQGQLTQDVQSMSQQEARPAGYCSAKGRLLATFALVRHGQERWWLITRTDLLELLARRLRMFVLRAKCSIDIVSSAQVRGSWEPGAVPWQVDLPSGDRHVDSQDSLLRMGWLGGRSLVVLPQAARDSGLPGGAPRGESDDILCGWPWIEPGTVEQFVPQMVNFELLGGVNFRKGCYPGQEVVARSQYRGTLKRRMGLFEVGAAAPVAATEIFHSLDAGQPAGMVVNASADPAATQTSLLLAEVKTAARLAGSLHLGSPLGPVLVSRELPYIIPAEGQ